MANEEYEAHNNNNTVKLSVFKRILIGVESPKVSVSGTNYELGKAQEVQKSMM